jgi:hypothetical protein
MSGEMTSLDGFRHVYDPETLSVMTNAFDRACDCFPVQFRGNDYLRKKLAMHIIHKVDDGESDPTRLADSAVLSLLWLKR